MLACIPWPSLRVCMPAYSKPDPMSGNREACGRKAIRRKIPCGAWLGLLLLSSLWLLQASGHTVRGDQQLTKDVIKFQN